MCLSGSPDKPPYTDNERIRSVVLLYTLIPAVIITLPWVVASRMTGAVVTFLASCFFGFLFTYFGLPSTAGPFFGDLGIRVMVFLFIGGIASAFIKVNGANSGGQRLIPLFAGCVAIVLYFGTLFFNSTWVNTREYAALMPHVDVREWNADFQPKDPKHFRVSSEENATFLAGRAIGQASQINKDGQVYAIGSQFQVFNDKASVQIIKGELWTIVPIDWVGWTQQSDNRTPGIPGYIKVSAENPTLAAQYVPLPKGKEFRYSPQSTFSQNLERLVWSYHSDKYIADTHLEIDDDGNPHYIVSLAMPTIGWWGEKIVGAVIINPVDGTGAEKFLALDKIPHWVDRVESQAIVHQNIDYHGKYSQGLWNTTVTRNSVLSATATHFGYGSDGEPVFATGVSAHVNSGSDKDKKPDSLVAVLYTNTRTGVTKEYRLPGGATEERAIQQCNQHGPVSNQKYHGTTPQLYNVYGRLAYVVPLQNASHAYQGVCIVDIMDIQVLAWGPNAHDAELAFKQVIVGNAQQLAIDGTRKTAKLEGIVSRVSTYVLAGNSTFSFTIAGVDHAFAVPVTASKKVPFTKVGDTIQIEFFDSKEEEMPVTTFDNTSIVLTASPIEQDVRDRAAKHQAEQRANIEGGRDAEAILSKLSPEDREALLKVLQKKQ